MVGFNERHTYARERMKTIDLMIIATNIGFQSRGKTLVGYEGINPKQILSYTFSTCARSSLMLPS